MALSRAGSVNSVVWPASFPETGSRRAERGLFHLAEGGLAHQRIYGNEAGVPAIGDGGIFEDRQHQAVVAGFAQADVLNRRGDGGDGCHRARGAQWLLRKTFYRGADGGILRGRGRKIESEVDPAALAIDAERDVLHIGGKLEERIGQTAASGRNVGCVTKSRGDFVGGFE